jgi:hypothetical protein
VGRRGKINSTGGLSVAGRWQSTHHWASVSKFVEILTTGINQISQISKKGTGQIESLLDGALLKANGGPSLLKGHSQVIETQSTTGSDDE